MNIDQIIQITTIIFSAGGTGGGLFSLYMWTKERPLKEQIGQLKAAKESLEIALGTLRAANEQNVLQIKKIDDLRDTLKTTKNEFQTENKELRDEFERKQDEMEKRLVYMFNLFEIQLLALNATPIFSRDNLMDVEVKDLKELIDKMKELASETQITEKDKKNGINKWAKMLDKFSIELEEDISNLFLGG